jgi:hypothetical protein
MSSIASSIYSKTYTADSDLPFSLEDDFNVILKSINIHCYTNDAYYGSGSVTSSIIRANAVVWFDSPVRVSDLVFRNMTAGSNTTIVITGVQTLE